MEFNKEIVCIVCPNGCKINITIDEKNNVIKIENAVCKNGESYAKKEIQCPERSLTSTVKVTGGNLPLVSVRSDKPIPKEKILSAVSELSKIELTAPVEYHQVIMENILGTGANIITTKQIIKV